MMRYSVIGANERRRALVAFVLVSFVAMSQWCEAQPPGRRVPPAPLGSPNVYVGPVANPFGQPPVPIGRGPVQMVPVQEYGSVPLFLAPVPYPGPTAARYPTPFDATARVIQPPSPVAMKSYAESVTDSKPAEESLAPLGNLRLTVSEDFLNRVIARDETKPGEVHDFILGAQVSGRQTTATRVRLDLLPGVNNSARGNLVLNGTTQSETTGVTPQAMVDVASQQEFVAIKEIFFDGEKFSTRHAVVHVRAKNQTLGAKTPLTGTLFGGIANRIAYREAERRRPQAEAVARDRVAERVYPEFDNAIDKQLATANEQLEGTVRRMMKAADLAPTAQSISSTNSSLSYSAQLATDSPLDVASPFDGPISSDTGLHIVVHESLLNAFAGRAGLKGLKTTDREMKAMLTPYDYKSGDALDSSEPQLGLPGMDSIVTDIEFDADEPLSIKIERNSVSVTLRAKFRPAGQDVLPPLELIIPYTTELVGDKIVVSPGKVKVTSLDNSKESVAAGIAMKLVSRGIEANLGKLAFDRSLPANLWPVGGPVPRVTQIVSDDGWAAISVD